ncbi:MAG: DUF2889 domain-containing protein [Hornefia sp.]|nr:DUF2889 domain-containing protein [Hornefia sp.]
MRINWCVRNLGEDLKATVTVTKEENVMSGSLVVDKAGFIIKHASGSCFKQNCGDYERYNDAGSSHYLFTELIGVLGYIQGKKIIKKRLSEARNSKFEDIFLQCVSALLQAETYVYRERGFESKKEYNEYWDILEKNGCRMYSDSRKDARASDVPWMDYVPDNFGSTVLFEREKEYEIKRADGTVCCKGHLSDSYHEMETIIEVDSKDVVKRNEIRIIRAPGISCFTNDENNGALAGRKLKDIRKKDIVSALGGCDGCYHIVEMYIESHRLLTEN